MTVRIKLELEIDEEIAKAWAEKQDENLEDSIINDVICTLEMSTDCGVDNASVVDCEFFED